MIRKIVLSSVLLIFLPTTSVEATPRVFVGDHILAPNTPGQTVEIIVFSPFPVESLFLISQIGDGGPDFGGSDLGPRITDVDLLTGTIFDGNNIGQTNLIEFDLVRFDTTMTASGSVSTSGLLATLTIDTTGFFTGSWPLLVEGTVLGRSNFGNTPMLVANGSISVPEPVTVLLMVQALAVLLGLAAMRRRRIRALHGTGS